MTPGVRRRPGPWWARGVVACAGVLVTTGCSGGPVEIDAPALSAADRAACERLVADLPETLAGLESRETTGDTAYGAAWGDPAIVLTCGVGVPAEFDEFSACTDVSGVGWFVPPEQEEDQDSDVLLTAAGHAPRVSLLVPADRRGAESADALVTISALVEKDLTLEDDCT